MLQGITPLELNKASMEQETPVKLMRGGAMEHNSSGKQSWADIVENEVEHEGTLGVEPQSAPKMRLWSRIVANIPDVDELELKTNESTKQNVKITMEDIKEEVEYLSNAVICYVLGSNPPPIVMNGYFHGIWGKLGIDKVAQVNRGVFLVRFTEAKSRMKVLEDGVQMFDKKPVIIKPWSPDVDTRNESFSIVPI